MVSPCGMPWVAGRWLRGGGGTTSDQQSLVRGRMQEVMGDALAGALSCRRGSTGMAREGRGKSLRALDSFPSPA